jgi:hypothetical protein
VQEGSKLWIGLRWRRGGGRGKICGGVMEERSKARSEGRRMGCLCVCVWSTRGQDVEQDDVDAAYRREPPAGKRRPVAGTKAAAESTHSRRRRAAAAIGEILRVEGGGRGIQRAVVKVGRRWLGCWTVRCTCSRCCGGDVACDCAPAISILSSRSCTVWFLQCGL